MGRIRFRRRRGRATAAGPDEVIDFAIPEPQIFGSPQEGEWIDDTSLFDQDIFDDQITDLTFSNGVTQKSLSLTVRDDLQAEGDNLLVWTIDPGANFGFSQSIYFLSESNDTNPALDTGTVVPIQLTLNSPIKTAIIIIQDNDNPVASLRGTANADRLFANQARASVYGFDGHDLLMGLEYSHLILGLQGNDLIYSGSATKPATSPWSTADNAAQGNEGNDQIYSDVGFDALDGGIGGDRIQAGSGNDTVFGFAGNDTLYGGSGDDELYGEDGNDHLFGGTGVDDFWGGAGADTFYLESASGVSYISDFNASEGDKIYLSATGFGLGPTDFNRLSYNTSTSELKRDGITFAFVYRQSGTLLTINQDIVITDQGFSGYVLAGKTSEAGFSVVKTGTTVADTLVGGEGNDTLDGGAGNDVLLGLELADRLTGGSGDDQINGGSGNDVLNGSDGNDQVFGASGNDRLFGQAGSDRLDGGSGVDTLNGGAGNDTYVVDDIADQIIDSSTTTIDTVLSSVTWTLATGLDQLRLTGSNPINGTGNELKNGIWGNAKANRLSGLAGNDTLWGGAGNDTLLGGHGADRLQSGPGSDLLTGGAGADTFVLETGLGVDTITDFVDGSDRVQLLGLQFNQIKIVQSGNDTLIRFGTDPLARLQGIQATTITVADFVL